MIAQHDVKDLDLNQDTQERQRVHDITITRTIEIGFLS